MSFLNVLLPRKQAVIRTFFFSLLFFIVFPLNLHAEPDQRICRVLAAETAMRLDWDILYDITCEYTANKARDFLDKYQEPWGDIWGIIANFYPGEVSDYWDIMKNIIFILNPASIHSSLHSRTLKMAIYNGITLFL